MTLDAYFSHQRPRARTQARLSGYLLVPLTLVVLCSTRGAAQVDSTLAPHATLRGWEEQAWITILDRGGSFFGRTSDRGILQRFNERKDNEYPIDLISFAWGLTETYEWHGRDNGFRARAGSINHLQLIVDAEFKASVAFGESWGAGAHLTQQETLESQRSLIRLRLERKLRDGGARLFLVGTLNSEKPESDMEVGFSSSLGAGTFSVTLAALDLFSDLVYEGLEIAASIRDTALDYRSHPYTARVGLDLPLGNRLRLESYALALTPTRVKAESQSTPGVGFIQDERYAYAGGLLEWTPTRRTALGGFATWARARLGRERLSAGRAEDDFDLTEKTWQLGLYGIQQIRDRFTVEGWLARAWRTEDRIRPDTTVAPNTDYEDRSWSGRAGLIYRSRGGLRAELGLDLFLPKVRGDLVPGERLNLDHTRLRLDWGWHFGGAALLVLGSNLDLDGDQRGPNFDGGHGRFVFYW